MSFSQRVGHTGLIAGAFFAIGTSALWQLDLSAHAAEAQPTGAAKQEQVAVKGMQRSFITYVPRTLKPNAPLLFVFHGSGGDGDSMRDVTAHEFEQLADRDGFVVVYPDGFKRHGTIAAKARPSPRA